MKIAVVGAGKMGISIMEALLGGGNFITLIDNNPERISAVEDRFDVHVLEADARNIEVLKSIGIDRYDAIVAATEDDELNMVICTFAKSLGCKKSIARVRTPEHIDQLDFIRDSMHIDHAVNPDYACAEEIFKYLTQKYSLQGGVYRGDGVSILEFKVDRVPSLAGRMLKDCGDVLSGMLIAAISRGGKIIIPNGRTVLEDTDTIYITGKSQTVKKFAEKYNKKIRRSADGKVRRVMIAGGGKTGLFLAEMLLRFGAAVKIIEVDRARCEYLADRLEGALVLCGDCTNMDLLHEEDLQGMDAFITATGFDEENLLLGMIAKKQGVTDVVAKISRKSYSNLVDSLGDMMTVNPLDMCASDIVKYIEKHDIVVFSQLLQGQAELTEIIAEEGMIITSAPLSDLEIPEGIIIAAVHRNDQIIVPKGDTQISRGDRVVLMCMLSQIPQLEALLKKQ